MAKKKSIDLSGVKTFLLAKGEKIGLGVMLAVAVLLILKGLLGASGAGNAKNGKPFAAAFDDAKSGLENQIRTAQLDPKLTDGADAIKPWAYRFVNFNFTPLIHMPDVGDTSRRNPQVVDIAGGKKNIQIDSIRGGVYVYELDQTKQTANALVNKDKDNKTSGRLLVGVRPTRFHVITSSFPLREQILEYQRALKLPNLDMLTKKYPENYPNFLGLIVQKFETSPGGKTVESMLYRYDPKSGKAQAAESVENFLRAAVVDEQNPQSFANFLHKGLITAVPKISHLSYPSSGRSYPAVELERLRVEQLAMADDKQPVAGGEKPQFKAPPPAFKLPFLKPTVKEAGPATKDGPVAGVEQMVPWTNEMAKDQRAKFAGQFFLFDPFLGSPDDKKGGMPRETEPKISEVPGENADPANRIFDAVIRFIDVDVEPGKTYHYKFQVVLQNPNYGKHKDVAFRKLADVKELYSNTVTTHSVSVPGEFDLYAVDQGDGAGKFRGPHAARWDDKTADRAPLQVHRWYTKGKGQETENQVADWLVAERLLVRRGEFIAQGPTYVPALIWNKLRDTFEFGKSNKPLAKGPGVAKAQEIPVVEIPAILVTANPAVVDFQGGRKIFKNNFIIEEAAFDVLILQPDGSLSVRNTRADFDDAERMKRLEAYRDRHIPPFAPAVQPKGPGGLFGGNS